MARPILTSSASEQSTQAKAAPAVEEEALKVS